MSSKSRRLFLLLVLTSAVMILIGRWLKPTSKIKHTDRYREDMIPEVPIALQNTTHKEIQSRSTRNIFYNRVGKCGSRSLLDVIWRLAKLNNFTSKTSRNTDDAKPDEHEVLHETKIFSEMRPRAIYDRHIYYIDFEKYGLEKPIYMNMIRDPIERFASQYNYLKYNDNSKSIGKLTPNGPNINDCVMKNIDLCNQTEYMFYIGFHFCGMDPICNKIGQRGRVDLAIKHIKEEYALVGFMEEFENTLKLLEKMLPEYFKGAMSVWEQHHESKKSTATRRLDVLNDFARKKLRQNMRDEYEVYDYARKKFDQLKDRYGIS